MDLSKFDVAVFDCDGVILDSNKVKSNAFGAALPNEDESLVRHFVEYHKENGGISRYVKFEHFFKELKGQVSYEQDYRKALQRYAAICRKNLLVCDEVPGVRKLLCKFQDLGVPCFVVSGGDEKEVREILTARELSGYFSDILGSPLRKEDNLNKLDKSQFLTGKGIYFGDAKSDFLAATKYSLDFVFVRGYTEWRDGVSFSNKHGCEMINDFTTLL